MNTQEVLAAEPATRREVEAVVEAFVALQETNRGTELAQVLTEDAVLDLNVPQWRFQVCGALAIAAAFAQAYAAGFRTSHEDWEPIPTGAVVEYDGWDVDRNTYYRHLARLQIRDGRIARLTIYCTGEWDADTIERQRREAPMVDHEQTGDPR